MISENTFIAFLRGINVGGHHKLPMADLKKVMEDLKFKQVKTILNSGNVIFKISMNSETELENIISAKLQKRFGFEVPTHIINSLLLSDLIKNDPFRNVEITSDIRLYITFLKSMPETGIKLPYTSEDKSFDIIALQDKYLCSVLDLSKTKSVKGMDILEKIFGKNITTRNWNTLKRIEELLNKS